jgi:hypothetical protein
MNKFNAQHIFLIIIIFINRKVFTTLMHNIKLPELEKHDEYLKRSPQERERYAEAKIKEIIQLNTGFGLTVTQIEDNTYFHRNTISKHTKNLISKGEVYQYPPNSRNGLLFSNGNLLDPIFKDQIILENKFFDVYVISNQFGKFLFIQEKKEDIYHQIENKGGIIVPIDEIVTFKTKLDDIIKQLQIKRIIR